MLLGIFTSGDFLPARDWAGAMKPMITVDSRSNTIDLVRFIRQFLDNFFISASNPENYWKLSQNSDGFYLTKRDHLTLDDPDEWLTPTNIWSL